MKVELEIPESLDMKSFDLSIYLAAKLYGDGILSSGQAADMVGLSKRTFIELLGKFGVSIFSESVEDLKSDLANA